ncbi:hypothetical protein ATHSA_0723 [Athalassotoga saccharophila]|nr:hypothetical protein ATHSA_0723 [Athalassotoga saccharophila]
MILAWFLIGALTGGISGGVVYFLISKIRDRGKYDNLDITEDVSRLIGKIQHVTNTNVDTLDKKISELRSAIYHANELYIRLNESMADRMNKISEVPQNLIHESPIHVESKESEEIFNDLDKEEKVLDLAKKGWNDKKIAESLGIGVGEVELILNLNSDKIHI